MTSHLPPPPDYRRLAELEQELGVLRREVYLLSGRTAQVVHPRHVRLARTAEDYGGEYPGEPCNTYPIIFLDGSFERTAGQQEADLTDRSATRQEYAYDNHGSRYFEEGTVVEVLEQNEQWWILGAVTPLLALVELSGDWEAGECEPCDPPDVAIETFGGEALETFGGDPLNLMEGVDEEDQKTWPLMREVPVVRYMCTDCSYAPSEEETLDVWHPNGYAAPYRSELQALHKDTGYWPAKHAYGAWAWAAKNGDSGRWELLPLFEEFWRFELQEELEPGGYASAKLVLWTGSDWNVVDLTFTVRDSLESLAAPIPVETRGFAKYFADSDEWEVVSIPTTQKARWIHFTLPSRLAPTDASKASCTVVDYWDGSDPGSTVTVYNIAASSAYLYWGPSGGKGLACYDAEEDKYKCVKVEQQALWIRFSLASTLTTSTASVSSCSVVDFWQGKDPGSTVTVYNEPASSNYIFSGTSGNMGLACYDEIEDKYKIVNMECP